MEIIDRICTILSTGFFITTIFLIIGLLLFHKRREELRNLLETAHIIFLAASAVLLIQHFIYTTTLIHLWFSNEDEFPQYAFYSRLTGPYWFSYWWMLLRPLFPMALLWKRSRRSIGVGMIMILFAIPPSLIERFIILITSLHRDYLPSSWTPEPFAFIGGLLVSTIIYSAVLTVVHLAKKGKLSRVKK
jgi:molybdopterin-containing oxidoreductase family membrane subunit